MSTYRYPAKNGQQNADAYIDIETSALKDDTQWGEDDSWEGFSDHLVWFLGSKPQPALHTENEFENVSTGQRHSVCEN